METDGQRSYSILTKTEVHEKMMEQVTQISEFFTLSKSDATVVLMHLRWNLDQASDYLSDKKDKFMVELGLFSSKTESNSLDTKGDDYLMISTPFCSHKFSTTCWRDYLIESLEKNRNMRGALISCLDQNCLAAVGPDTIEKLSEPVVKEMYESYVLGSFLEGNKDSIKWCPEEGCGYAIKLHEDAEESCGFGVVCLCGHTFCWRCRIETHRPVSCENASIWLNKFLDQARSLDWIAKNTKLCPSCNCLLLRGEGASEIRITKCICRYTFCWVCLRPEEAHNGKWNCARKAIVLPPMNQATANYENTQIRRMDTWDANHQAIEKAKSDLTILEQNQIPKLTESCGLGEQEIKALKEAWILIVQCKQVLKWSSVYEYFVPEDQVVKRQYVNHLREKAHETLEKHKMYVQELIEEAISAGASYYLAHKVETVTANTGSYFHEYVKTLEDGCPEVED